VPEAAPLADEEANATVAEVFPKLCRVRLDDGTSRLCSYRRATVMAPRAGGAAAGWKERAPVAVGDRVRVHSTDPGSGVVEGVCARRNFLARPAPDRDEGMVHVLASNLDVLLVVASASHPEFSPGLVDRFLVAASRAGIQSALCITKRDLPSEAALWEPYLALGFPVFEVSSRERSGLDTLHRFLRGKRAVFCGHSGVGKTSLLNELLGRPVGRVGAMSEATGKGRHTTTSAVLIDAPGDSLWIDTPGVREFGLWAIEPEGLASHFPEFESLPWAREARLPSDDELSAIETAPRGTSYRRILASLLEGER
jgi:ribosome biogenesis GTPase